MKVSTRKPPRQMASSKRSPVQEPKRPRLSEAHAKRIGLRSLDLLHAGACLEVKCRAFITCDHRQSALAKAAGLNVTPVEAG